MIFRIHTPRFPLSQFIEAFIYFERAEHAHTVDRFLPNGDTEILIDFSDKPQYVESWLLVAFRVVRVFRGSRSL